MTVAVAMVAGLQLGPVAERSSDNREAFRPAVGRLVAGTTDATSPRPRQEGAGRGPAVAVEVARLGRGGHTIRVAWVTVVVTVAAP